MSASVVTVKLVPDRAQARSLADTLRACNAAANHVSEVAFERRIWRKYDLRKVVYGDIRDRFGLKSQTAQQVISKVVDAYNSGDRKWRHGAVRRSFRTMSAQPFDRRNSSLHVGSRTVDLTLLDGRCKNIRFECADWQAHLIATDIGLRGHHAEMDLIHRNGSFYLAVTVNVVDKPLNDTPDGWIGVDMGIVNIATTSTGTNFSGNRLNQLREQYRRTRRRLQKKGTRSAKRRLAQQSRRETRMARDINHCISKTIVTEAERTGRGIAIENLEGIRSRARHRKPQRVTLHSWSFHQLGTFLTYKAQRAGVPLVEVDPAYTSQTCNECKQVDRNARIDRNTYVCTNPDCSFVGDADQNAAHNIAERGEKGWAVSHAATRHTNPTAPSGATKEGSVTPDGQPAGVPGTTPSRQAPVAGKLGPSGPRS